ncbi:MAG: insulinase family protein [Deltaproteobacteria bacterium]|nr:insulinase family protein [Deltaproteobacteria bacterium]
MKSTLPLAALLAAAFTGPVASAAELSIPHEIYTLDNGLTVILAPDNDVPIVQVNVWYHVGSAEEVVGRTGFAHLFEHLMFQGSEHNNNDYFQPLQEVGGQVNGTTNLERTNYFEGVPSEYLPLALWAEADRMGYLLPALSQERLDNQKEVVRNERRQRYENRPYGTVWVTLLDNVFPESHPYNHSTIGEHADLEAATLDDVTAFFKTWYVPNNASIVICGDFDVAEAKQLIELYFAQIPAGAEPTPATIPAVKLTEEKVIRQTEAGAPFQKVWIAWPSPGVYAPGDAELDLLSTTLSDGQSSRLVSELVVKKQIATDVMAYQSSFDGASMFVIEATAAAGHTTDELVAEIDKILKVVKAKGPTVEEVEMGRTAYEVGFYQSLFTVAGKADRLNSYFVNKGRPDALAEDLQRYLDATPESIRATAESTLGTGRVVLHIWPATEAK